MRMSLRNGVIQLGADRPLAIRGARHVELECTEGRVWLTLEGRPEDFVLAEGERVRIDNDGLALVEGYPAGAVRLIGAAHRPIARALARGWRRIARTLAPRRARTRADATA